MHALQQSSTLVALVSPHYFRSPWCGREFEVFQQRYDLLRQQSGDTQPHRILPVCWFDVLKWQHRVPAKAKSFFENFQYKSPGMPEDYTTVGLYKFYDLDNPSSRRVCHALAERIVQLSDHDSMPPLNDLTRVHNIDNAFAEVVDGDADEQILSGPNALHVVYVVGTRSEMTSIQHRDADAYSEIREDWRAFADAPGATAGLSTREGFNLTDLRQIRTWGWPQELLGRMEQAAVRNSLVLLVFDRRSLLHQHYKDAMRAYDQHHFPNVALVTAGGDDISEAQVQAIFPAKFQSNYRPHLWHIPAGRDTYVKQVGDMLRELKYGLMDSVENRQANLTSGTMPTLGTV